jgi:hypothetical protein
VKVPATGTLRGKPQILQFLQRWNDVSHVVTCQAPHHDSFKQLLSEKGILTAAQHLLGLCSGELIPASPANNQPFGVSQEFALCATKSHRSALRPLGNLPPVIPVQAVAELPSSITLRFQFDNAREVQLCCHVQPATYGTSTITYVLRWNYLQLPGYDALVKYVSISGSFCFPVCAKLP